MALKERYNDIKSQNDDINRSQMYLRKYLSQFDDIPFLDGVIVSSSTIGTTQTIVNHGLGRTPVGWIVLDKNADSRIWRSGAFSDRFLLLTSSANVTVSLWVF